MTFRSHKLKHCCFLKGRVGWQNLRSEEFTDEGPFLITGMHFADGRVDWGRCFHVSPERYALDLSIHVREGDVLITKDGSIGKLAYIDSLPGPACLNSHLLIIRPRDGFPSARFLFYLLKSERFERYILQEQAGTTFYGISQESVANFEAPMPQSEQDQLLISTFLDSATRAIDVAVAKKQRLIELLDEKRSALVSHAIANGLNPVAPTKESGVGWLGRIPAHWRMVRLRHLSPRIGVGLVINPSTYTCDNGVPFIFGGNVIEYGFNLDGVRMISPSDSRDLPASQLHAGDLVTVRVGYPGVTAVVPAELEGANCASVMIVRKGPEFNSDWLCFALNSRVGRYQVERVQYGAAQEQFNIGHAVDFWFPVPPMAEQRLIAETLAGGLAVLSASNERDRRSIALLREYRSALITAAVTGQLDIREHEKKLEALAG